MKTKEKIINELDSVNQELIMSSYNDGWWNRYMIEKKEILEKLLKEIENENDNNRILNKKS
jgi:hypothetical protein